MRGRIGLQNYDSTDCIEDSAQFRPLQVSTLRLSAHEPTPLMLAQRKQALLGSGAYGSSVVSFVLNFEDDNSHYLQIQLVQSARGYAVNRAQCALHIRIRSFRNLLARAVWSH